MCDTFPDLINYPSLPAYAESLIDFSDTYEMTGSLKAFFEDAMSMPQQKAYQKAKPGVYTNVRLYDINSLYPAALTHVYTGPAKPFEPGNPYSVV